MYPLLWLNALIVIWFPDAQPYNNLAIQKIKLKAHYVISDTQYPVALVALDFFKRINHTMQSGIVFSGVIVDQPRRNLIDMGFTLNVDYYAPYPVPGQCKGAPKPGNDSPHVSLS